MPVLGISYAIYHGNAMWTNKIMAERLKAGSNPLKMENHSDPPKSPPRSKLLLYKIDRPDVVKSIQRFLFKPDTDSVKIGVILGPTG